MREFNEVKALGSLNSTKSTAKPNRHREVLLRQRLVQFNTALRDQATVRKLDLVDAARMFAAADMSIADTVISIWHSKYVYGFWRPITAIHLADTDGNSKTIADLNWQPMLATSPYPDYVSGYAGLMGALIRALQDTSDTQHLQLTLTSTAVPNVTRFYDSGKVACQEVVDARVWLGIHFRSADVRGERMGEQVAEWALDRYFRPVSSPKSWSNGPCPSGAQAPLGHCPTYWYPRLHPTV